MAIRADPNINGITVKQKETKLIKFADGTTAVIEGKGSAKNFIRILSEFAKISGLKVIKEKNQVLWI